MIDEERCRRRVQFLFDFGKRLSPAKLSELWWRYQDSKSPCARYFAEWAFNQAKLKLRCLRPMHAESMVAVVESEQLFKEAPKELLGECWAIKVMGAPVKTVKACVSTTSTEPLWLAELYDPEELQTLVDTFEGGC